MHWPTYNVADVAIVVGVGLMVIDMLVPMRKAPQASPLALVPATGVAQDAGGAGGTLEVPVLVPAEPLVSAPGEASPSGEVAVDVDLDGAVEPLPSEPAAPAPPVSERPAPSPRS
jgi:hypothetical protein